MATRSKMDIANAIKTRFPAMVVENIHKPFFQQEPHCHTDGVTVTLFARWDYCFETYL
jgi:hypothetical protein